MITASYEYQSQGITFLQCATLTLLALFFAWQGSQPGDKWWATPLVRVVSAFAVAAYVFTAWAAATG